MEERRESYNNNFKSCFPHTRGCLTKSDMLPFEDTEKEKLYLRRELFLCGKGTYPLKDLLKQ